MDFAIRKGWNLQEMARINPVVLISDQHGVGSPKHISTLHITLILDKIRPKSQFWTNTYS